MAAEAFAAALLCTDPDVVGCGRCQGCSTASARTHGDLLWVATDRVMILLPLHHVLPLQGTLIMPLSINATCVMAPSMVAADILQTLADNHVTLFIGVPRLFILLRDSMKSRIRQSTTPSAVRSAARSPERSRPAVELRRKP